ncbi:MAG: dihydroorotase [Desulfovibrionaceae bacterium]|nr:MAG: dihydroorotase [Desulfovibrionaceae bacterium]
MMILRNARYLGEPHDLLVRDGRVAAFGPAGSMEAAVPSDAETVDAAGQVLFPSFIDAHVHLREPGFKWKEDVASGLSAAAHGGVGRVLCMANTDPINDDAGVTRLILDAGARSHPHGPYAHPVAAATVGLKGQELAPLGELAAAGCVAVSNDGVPLADTEIVRRVMEYAADLGLILIDHCEDPALARKAHMSEGRLSGLMGVKGQPDAAEAIQAARDILLADYLGLPVHIAHVSCRRTLDVIAWGKARGVRVTAETCPHYLLLDESALEGYNTNAKVNPPLRTPDDVEAMRTAVKSGLIDILVTDHAPHAAHEKEHPLDQVPNGITGLDTAVTLMWALIAGGILDEADLMRLYAWKPADIFGLPVNRFQPGDPADFCLFDPGREWVVEPHTLYSKSANTPWLGKTLRGRVSAHWMGGVQIV